MDVPPRPHLPRHPLRRALPWLLVLAGLAAAAAAGRWLPDAGLRWGLVEGLRALGMADVVLGGADLSLFQGRVVVRGVTAHAGGGAPLNLGGARLDFRWRPLLDRRVSLRALELDGVEIAVRRAGEVWEINGLPVVVDGGGGGWSFEADSLRLADSRMTIADGGVTLDVEIGLLTVEGLRGWDPEAELEWRFEGRVNGAAVSAQGTAAPFAARPRLTLTASVERFDLGALAAPARRAGIETLAGRLSTRLAVVAGDGPLRAKGKATVAGAGAALGVVGVSGDLDWTGALTWRSGGLEADGTLRADSLRIGHPDGGVEMASAAWTGTLAAGDRDRPLRAEGRLDVTGMVGRLGEHRVDHARAGATGAITLLAATDGADTVMPPVDGALDLWVEGLLVGDPGLGRAIAAAERVAATGVTFSPAAGAKAARIEASGLAAKDGRVRIARAAAENGAVTAAGAVTVASLSLADVSARLVRTGDGFEGFPVAGGEGGGEPPRVALGRLKVTGGRVEFEDRTPSEPVRLGLDGVELSVRGLDTGQPDRDSPFRLAARLQGARIEARGALRPFAPSLSGTVKGKVAALDLPPLSPYAADSLGVHLHTGQFDGELTVSLDQGALDGRMDIVLSKLFVAQPDPRAPLAVQADMPVETVLDLLRDSEQRIRLTIPVRGDLSRPDFDVSDAVSQAVGGALKSTVVTTLKVAFPVVALIGFVIDEASTPRLSLEPLDFAAGEHDLAPVHGERLGTVAALLRQRPGVRLNVCGVATSPADWPVLAERRRRAQADLLSRLRAMVGQPTVAAEDTPDGEALSELADRRAQAVKAWLVEQGGIDPGRLFLCRPRVSGEAGAAPRVDLLI